MLTPGDPLYLDVSDDLRRVDQSMTRLLLDRKLFDEFLRNPNGVLVQVGLHPETTHEINSRVNRIFWATLTDQALLEQLSRHYATFTPERLGELQHYFIEGLREGVVRHDPDYDLQVINHLLDNERVLAQLISRNLEILNRNDLLERRYAPEDLRAYVDGTVRAIRDGTPIKDHPKLEVWDDNYGIGQPFGGVMWEAGPGVTVIAAAQGIAYVTVYLEVGFWSVALEEATRTAITGDPPAIRALALVGRALDFGGELLAHAYAFQRRNFQ
jgi:hypothetical protein